jgi:urease accessory protein
MRLDEPVLCAARWDARLSLEFARRDGRSLLAARRHHGPLVVQKTLHPEGEGVCHAIVLHPPGGICGGDALAMDVAVNTDAHALITTPGAGKWYRSSGSVATQQLRFDVGPNAIMEWLPQETIIFDGARAALATQVNLTANAVFIGWEVLCLGRSAAGERFATGMLTTTTRISLGGKPLWLEHGYIAGGDNVLAAASGMAGQPVSATLLATTRESTAELSDALRAQSAADGVWGVTFLPRLMVARYLGPSAQAARDYFRRLWQIMRPALAGREALPPRIWKT